MSTAAPKDLLIAADPTVYPIEDDVGEGSLQRLISELLRPLIERWLAEKGRPTFVGADQYFYWKQFDPHECVAPDVYVLPEAPLNTQVGAWLTWKTGYVPSFALEVVSDDVRKDYLRSPPRYDRLGVKELVVFDPGYDGGRPPIPPGPAGWEANHDRFRFQVFRRVKNRGLVRVEATNADRVRSRVLGCWLRAVGEGAAVRVRLASGHNGETLFPTDGERAEAERAAREQAEITVEAERAAREKAEAAVEAERAAREKAEAELERLRAELKRRG